jgi:hypothetical protein
MNRYKTFHIGENIMIKKANKIFLCQFAIAVFLITIFILKVTGNIHNIRNIGNTIISIFN